MQINKKKLSNLFLFFATLFFLLIIRVIFSFNGLYGQDGYEYVKLCRGLHAYFFSGSKMPYSVFPLFYPLTGFLFSLFIRNELFALQFVSMLAGALACVYVKKITVLIYERSESIYAYIIAFFLFSPYLLRFSELVMSDMTAICFVLITTFYSFRFTKTNTIKDFAIASVFASVSIYVRYASAIVLLILAIMLVLHLYKIKKLQYIFITAIIFLIISLPEYIISKRLIIWDMQEQKLNLAYFYVPQQWSFINFFKKDFFNIDGWEHYAYPNILFVFQNWVHPAFVFCGIIFLVFLRKNDFKNIYIQWLLISILFYSLFAAGYAYQSNRYLLFTFPFIAIIFYPAFLRIKEKFFRNKILLYSALSLIICIQFALTIYSMRVIYGMNQTEKEIASSLKQYSGKTIYTFSIDNALKTYGVNNAVVDIYSNKIDSVKNNSLLLFNDMFREQFAGLNPMLNWEFIQKNYKVEQLTSYPGGWKLYSVGK